VVCAKIASDIFPNIQLHPEVIMAVKDTAYKSMKGSVSLTREHALGLIALPVGVEKSASLKESPTPVDTQSETDDLIQATVSHLDTEQSRSTDSGAADSVNARKLSPQVQFIVSELAEIREREWEIISKLRALGLDDFGFPKMRKLMKKKNSTNVTKCSDTKKASVRSHSKGKRCRRKKRKIYSRIRHEY
jgi:hypothetical protein